MADPRVDPQIQEVGVSCFLLLPWKGLPLPSLRTPRIRRGRGIPTDRERKSVYALLPHRTEKETPTTEVEEGRDSNPRDGVGVDKGPRL